MRLNDDFTTRCVAAGFPVFLFPRPFRSRDEFCSCTELLDVSVGAIHTK